MIDLFFQYLYKKSRFANRNFGWLNKFKSTVLGTFPNEFLHILNI